LKKGLQILWRNDIEFKLDADAKWNFKVKINKDKDLSLLIFKHLTLK